MPVRQPAFVRSHRRTFFTLVALLGPVTLGSSASAQVVLRAENERIVGASTVSETYVSSSDPGARDRDHAYRQLQQEAAIVERERALVRRIIQLTLPTVVHIEASKKSDAGPGLASSRVDEAGAGVIIQLRNQLYVLTNRHVVHPAEPSAIRIELNDRRQIRPTKIWADPSTDVAVLQIDGQGLVPARIGDSDQMEMGDFVLAFGSPFGLSRSVTEGILSAKGRRNLELGSRDIEIQDFFQVDAAINPGNSGGPLLNLRGEVIGINTAIASNSGGNEGIGFTIPINMAMTVAEQLITRGRLQRAYLGVQLENAFSGSMARQLGLPNNEGALVKAIIPGSPAEKAGIQVGDVVLEFDGNKIENDGHLVKTVGLTPLGKQVGMIIFRDHRRLNVSIMLDPSPEN
ncbi:MAG: S1C family serine protease [Aureliella sp.]